MAYQRGFLKDRITILNRTGVKVEHGAKRGEEYAPDGSPIYANVSYLKGMKAMAEASIDALSTYLVRCDYHKKINDHSKILWKGKTYWIEPPQYDEQKNEMQIRMHEEA